MTPDDIALDHGDVVSCDYVSTVPGRVYVELDAAPPGTGVEFPFDLSWQQDALILTTAESSFDSGPLHTAPARRTSRWL